MPVSKPQLRGLLANTLKKNAAVCFTVAIGAACIWRFGYAEPRKAKYRDFYKTYDAQKDFERMRDAGVFQSVRPGGAVGSLD